MAFVTRKDTCFHKPNIEIVSLDTERDEKGLRGMYSVRRTSGRYNPWEEGGGKGRKCLCKPAQNVYTFFSIRVQNIYTYTRLEEIRCLDIDNLRVAKERHHPVSTSAFPILSDDVPHVRSLKTTWSTNDKPTQCK